MISTIIFLIVWGVALYFFIRSVKRIRKAILLGKDREPITNRKKRWLNVLLVAFGQKKMFKRPFPALLHLCVYLGFLIINIEVAEIVLDGILGTHRFFAPYLNRIYNGLTSVWELFYLLVFLASGTFLVRRYSGAVKRFHTAEMTRWPKLDAYIILWTEIVLVTALFFMNAADQALQERKVDPYIQAGYYPFSQWVVPLFSSFSTSTLIFLERFWWWVHLIGILAFLNYIPYSKHLHIFLAFPNTYYSDTYIKPLGAFPNNRRIFQEVQSLFSDTSESNDSGEEKELERFGAKDVFDLYWTDLLAAYTCTECGRCTSVCPAHLTGRKLSPRKIMMDTRDRCEEVIARIEENQGQWKEDGKSLLYDYITTEELWACTTCNACAEECPVNINPVSIILQLRQYLILEESKAPDAWLAMFQNIENNGAPWALPAADRSKWTEEINP